MTTHDKNAAMRMMEEKGTGGTEQEKYWPIGRGGSNLV
jgi:hypothetical protein